MRTCDLTTEDKPKQERLEPRPVQEEDWGGGGMGGGRLVSKRRAEGTKPKAGASEARPLPHKQVSAPSEGNAGVSGEEKEDGDGPAKDGCCGPQEQQTAGAADQASLLLLGRCRQSRNLGSHEASVAPSVPHMGNWDQYAARVPSTCSVATHSVHSSACLSCRSSQDT